MLVQHSKVDEEVVTVNSEQSTYYYLEWHKMERLWMNEREESR